MGQALGAAEAYYHHFATGDFPAASALFAEDAVIVTPVGTFDKAGHLAFGLAFRAAFPDGHMEILRELESGLQLYVGGRFKGTHTGDLVGPDATIPASGNTLDLPYTDYFRVADGKITTLEVVFDQLNLLGQLDAL